MKHLIARCLAAVALTAGLFAHAEPVWTDSSWTVATTTLTPSEQNLVRGSEPKVTAGSIGSEGCGDKATLTDGVILDDWSKTTVLSIGNDTTLVWEFDEVKSVRGIRFFAEWGNANRSKITISSITGLAPNGETVTLAGSHEYINGQRTFSAVADDAGGILGKVKSISINFGTQQNGYVGYAEIEVVGEKAMGEVKVTGAPGEYGQVEPDYGQFFGMPDETAVFTAPASFETEDARFTCVGWKLFDAEGVLVRDSATGSGEGESATCCKIPYQDETLRLEWQWATQYKVTPAADDPSKGGVEVSDPFAASGTEVTLTPVPNTGFAFHHWEGLPAGADVWSRVQKLTVTGPLSPTAVFGRAVAVSDAAELAAAVGAQEDLDVIELAKGTYAIDSQLEITKSVRLDGATGDSADVVIDAQKKCKALSLANEWARLSAVTVANGYTTVDSDKGGGIYMTSGTVKNCVVRDCVLLGTKSVGGGIYMTGAKTLVEDSLVTHCAAGRQGGACGIYNSDGTIRRTEISGCYPVTSSTTYRANIFSSIGLEQTGASALTENCVVTDNVAVNSHRNFANVGGIRLSGGEVRNTLIAGNFAGVEDESGSEAVAPGGVYVNGGRLVNCTVTGNRATRATSAGGIHLSSGTVENCLVVDNVNAAEGGAGDIVGGDTGTWLNNAVRDVAAVTVGSGNFEADEVPFAPGGYELAVGSSCAGAGKVEEWMAGATDLAGFSRLREVRGVKVVDVGAYAVAPAGRVTVLGEPVEVGAVTPGYGVNYAADGEPSVCTAPAVVVTDDMKYTCAGWKLADAMGTPVRDSETGRTAEESVTCCIIPFGDVPMRLEWQWASEYAVAPTCDEEKGSVAVDKAFAPCGAGVTLTASAKDGFAFHHWENLPAGADVWKATTTVTVTESLAPLAVFGRAVPVGDTAGLLAAVAEPEDFDVIVLAKGTYAIDARLEIGTNVRLNGATGDPADVVIDAQEKCKVVSLANEYACLAFLTVANGYATEGSIYARDLGAGVYMTAGAVVGCIVRDCVHTGTGSLGGGIYMTGAKTLVEDSLVTHCAAGRQGGGCGVCNVNGTIRRTRIINCYPTTNMMTANIYTAVGLDQSGVDALTENCIVTNNVAGNSHMGFNNVGGVNLTGGVVRNTLIAGNSTGQENESGSATVAPGGVWVNGGRLVNCTVLGNKTSRAASCGGVHLSSGSVINCVIWDNVLTGGEAPAVSNWTGTDANFTYCLTTPALSDPNSLSAAPKLRGGRLLPSSAGVDAGCNEEWMTGAADLRGNPRIVRDRVDMGAYESLQQGLFLLVR